jgi:uncharacterized protein DUF3306
LSAARDFWSRRLAGVDAEEATEQAALEARALAAEQAVLDDKSDDEVLSALGLPAPETMKMGDDFAAFMAKAVPDHIRRRALRSLWRTNPVLANVDMLVDYGGDFTDSAFAVENIQTAYQVGKGMLKHVEEVARQAEETLAAENQVEELPEADVDDVDTVDTVDDAVAASEHVAANDDPVEPETEITDVPPAPRRMTFRTEEFA